LNQSESFSTFRWNYNLAGRAQQILSLESRMVRFVFTDDHHDMRTAPPARHVARAVNFKLDVASTIKFRRLFAPVGARV
jgi:hypothetical protein